MKRLMAVLIIGTMLLPQSLYAEEMPENHWASEDMQLAEMYGWCTVDQYADYVTYEDGNELINEVLSYLLFNSEEAGQVFNAVDYTNSYVTRGEWAEAMSVCIDMAYMEADELMAEMETDEGCVKEDLPESDYDHALPEYVDINADNEHNGAINECYVYGIMNGYEGNIFKPDEYISYAEAVTCLSRLRDNIDYIMLDKGIDMDALYNYYYGYDEELNNYMLNAVETFTDIIGKAEKGTLKSNRKLGRDTEKAVKAYLDCADKLKDVRGIHCDSTVSIRADIDAYGENIKADILMDITGDITYNDENEIEGMAMKATFSVDAPGFENLTGISMEEYKNFCMEMYIKDGYSYQNINGEKTKFILYNNNAVVWDSAPGMDYKTNAVLSEYIIRESITGGSVTEKTDGTEVINSKLDLKRLLAALGFDIDKLIELSGEDIEINFTPVTEQYVIDNDGNLKTDKSGLSVTFSYEDISGTVKIAAESGYTCSDDMEIAYPDLSGYIDYTEEFFSKPITEDTAHEEDALTAVVGSADGPTAIFTAE